MNIKIALLAIMLALTSSTVADAQRMGRRPFDPNGQQIGNGFGGGQGQFGGQQFGFGGGMGQGQFGMGGQGNFGGGMGNQQTTLSPMMGLYNVENTIMWAFPGQFRRVR